MRLWRLMGRYDAESTTYTAVAGTNGASPYRPDFSGQLIALRTIVGGGAATSLVNHIQWKLTATTFVPNSIECAAQGSGLQTAPAVKTGEVLDFPVDQKVRADIPITIEARNLNAEQPVTVDAFLYGLFEV